MLVSAQPHPEQEESIEVSGSFQTDDMVQIHGTAARVLLGETARDEINGDYG
jgi:hypothetical protein